MFLVLIMEESRVAIIGFQGQHKYLDKTCQTIVAFMLCMVFENVFLTTKIIVTYIKQLNKVRFLSKIVLSSFMCIKM